MEECNFSEFITEMEKKTAFLKQELKNMMKTEQNLQSDRVKDNNQEGEAVEEAEKEEKKPDEQQKEKARCEGASPNEDPASLKKKFTSSGAVENLHQGLHTSGTKFKAGSLSSQSQAGRSCSDSSVARGKISFGAYEPSFGQIALGWQDRTSGEQGCDHLAPAERKKQLIKELFGEGCLPGEEPSSSSSTGGRQTGEGCKENPRFP